MYSYIKTPEEINKIRIASNLASNVLKMIKPYIKSGISTNLIDKICYKYITIYQKAYPACLGYNGYPKSICISVNEVVCHGIPNNETILKNGDIVNIDVTVLKNGFYGDTSKMFFVGNISTIGKNLCLIAQESLYLAIKIIRPFLKLNYIGKIIENFVNKKNFSIVKEYCGHGIGKKFHEPPQVLHFYDKNNNIILYPGMIFTIEPMINSGKRNVIVMKDKWTVKTKDNSLSAQYEHTILVTKNGCEILTFRENENINKIINHN
ncbi:type I methionyl aminopeptidase [Sodalis-like secondary symbiont of Drepanosiphum platanoidis]|uniref:type I methionyl aminopeptidase n=1 Tax=Sodalis-like secondary symbiont of Drepanosiphum platanoidis TaxID=2994493 RepID=UPI003464B069